MCTKLYEHSIKQRVSFKIFHLYVAMQQIFFLCVSLLYDEQSDGSPKDNC